MYILFIISAIVNWLWHAVSLTLLSLIITILFDPNSFQLNCLDQIKYHKNHFLYLKLMLMLSGDISLNQEPIQTDHLKADLKTFWNRDLHFICLNIKFSAKNWWTKRNSKFIKPYDHWYYRNKIRLFDWWFRQFHRQIVCHSTWSKQKGWRCNLLRHW